MDWTSKLLDVMAQLRDPQQGCPWDVKQDFATIAPCTIEEAYEVVDAIERQDWASLKEELGDLLLQVVYHAQMAKEKGWFGFEDVSRAICEKLIIRHPHVFGDKSNDSEKIKTAEDQIQSWEKIKKQQRDAKTRNNGGEISILDDIPLNLPSLSRALKLQKRAAKVGFDWEHLSQVLEKLEEEIHELKVEIERGECQSLLREELGDVLFSACAIARHLKIDPEEALRHTNAKFLRRFHHIEASLRKQGKGVEEASLDEMDSFWHEARHQDKLDNGRRD